MYQPFLAGRLAGRLAGIKKSPAIVTRISTTLWGFPGDGKCGKVEV